MKSQRLADLEKRLRSAGIAIDDAGNALISHFGHTTDLYKQYVKWAAEREKEILPYDVFVDSLLECGYKIIAKAEIPDTDRTDYFLVRPALN